MLVRLLIVDDDADFRRTARRALAGDGYEIVGEAETVAQARTAIRELDPAAVLLDVRLPDGSGATLAGELRASAPGLRVLLTSSDDLSGPSGIPFVAKTDLIGTDLSAYLG